MSEHAHVIARHPVQIGAALGLATLPAHALLPLPWAEQLAALDGRRRVVLVETAGASAFALFALWAVQRAPVWLPAGYVAHAFWDLAHHRSRLDVRMPRWYVPFCAAVDLVAGAGIALLWWARG